jgi:hypothetical protein
MRNAHCLPSCFAGLSNSEKYDVWKAGHLVLCNRNDEWTGFAHAARYSGLISHRRLQGPFRFLPIAHDLRRKGGYARLTCWHPHAMPRTAAARCNYGQSAVPGRVASREARFARCPPIGTRIPVGHRHAARLVCRCACLQGGCSPSEPLSPSALANAGRAACGPTKFGRV